jgi:hypothetical protein
MPPSAPKLLPETLQAVLLLAREMGKPGLTTTTLVKLTYLVDYFTATETGGAPFTETPWEFLHYGPFHSSLLPALALLVTAGAIDEQTGGGVDKDYTVYSLPTHREPKSLDDLGVPRNARMNVERRLREFSGDQSALLNFVYYETEPMQGATPASRLDFSVCQPTPYASVRPLAMKPVPPAKLAAYRANLAALRNRMRPPPIEWKGKYDEVYYGAMAELDGEGLGEVGSATLHI